MNLFPQNQTQDPTALPCFMDQSHKDILIVHPDSNNNEWLEDDKIWLDDDPELVEDDGGRVDDDEE